MNMILFKNVEIVDHNYASRVLYFIHLYLVLHHWATYVPFSDLTHNHGSVPNLDYSEFFLLLFTFLIQINFDNL